MRAFILGNSGELLDHDLRLLQGEIVFGTNCLPLRIPEIITHYVLLDIGMAFLPEIRTLVPKKAKKYYSRLVSNTIYKEDNVDVYETCQDHLTGFNFSDICVFPGYTVSYVSLQIAAGLGFNPIYMLGVDLGLPANGIMHIPEQQMALDLMHSKNLSSPFTPKENRDIHFEDFKKPLQNFQFSRMELDKFGIKVYNLSKGGKLNCFPRKNFNEVISNHDTEIVSDVELVNKES